MKQFDFLIWSALLFINCTVYAQDQTNFTQFYLNPYLLNPSFAGIDGKAAVTFIYRKQWSTIPDGPRISNVSLHTPVTRRLSLGLSATNDVKGLLNTSSALLTFGYSIPIGEFSFMRFGISGGGSWNTIDLEKLNNALLDDPALANLLENNASLNGNAGISFHLKSFHFGVALPVIFEPSYISKDEFTITEIKPFQTLNLHLSNRFYFDNNKHVFEPYAVYRMSADANASLPPQFEVAGILHLNHVVWLGGSYKQDYGISALGGVKLKNTFAIGGAYSIKNSGVNELNSPSYEIALGILFGQKRKEAPVYSFVNTEIEKPKKSPSQLIAERQRQEQLTKQKQEEELAKRREEELAKQQAEQDRQEQLAKQQQEQLAKQQQEQLARQQQEQLAKQQQEQLAKQQQEQLAKQQQETLAKQQQEEFARRQREEEAAKKQQELLAQKQQEEAAKQQEPAQPIQTQTPTRVQQKLTQEEIIARTTVRMDTVKIFHRPRFNQIDASMEIFNVEITEHSEHDEHERISRLTVHADDPDEHHEGDDHPNAERHEFIKRGTHKQELNLADYVISGVFGQEGNAKHFVDGLKKMGFKANYGHLTEKNLWYVYLIQTNDINQARAERDKYRKMKIFRDAWLLTVHN